MNKLIPLTASLLMAAVLALPATPAAAQYAGFKAAITKQINPVNAGDHSIVELTTIVPIPYQLMFRSLTPPPGVTFKGVKIDSSCPEAGDARKCRQYFTMAIDAHSSGKCTLDGNYVANFQVTCLSGDSACKPGSHEVGFSLKSENFCTEKLASTGAFWTKLNGLTATDVGSGGKDFLVWYLDASKSVPGGYDVVSLGYNKTAAMRRSGGAVRIDVDEQGSAFIANDKGEMFRYVNNAWQKLPGLAKDIGIGANGTAWHIGTNAVSGGFGIYRWTGSDWKVMPGGAVRIDVDPQGNAWVVNDANQIWRWNGSGWTNVPGAARDIGIGNKGAVYAVGTDGIVYKWNAQTNNWESRGGANATDITVNSDGAPVIVTQNREVLVGQP